MALTTAPAIDYALPRQQDEGDHWIDDWRPEDPGVLGDDRQADRPP